MYLEQCHIRNIKCFEDIALDFRNPDGSIRLWNVFLGENGTGKTVLLQSIAIVLLGEKAASVLLPRPWGWVRTNAANGAIEATISPGQGDTWQTWQVFANPDQGRNSEQPIRVSYNIETAAGSVQADGATIRETTDIAMQDKLRGARHPRSTAWFAAGYGPFRRLHGSSKWRSDTMQKDEREARFVTLFQEDAALTDCEEWLMKLDYARKDEANPERRQKGILYDTIEKTLNNYLLPDEVRLNTVSSQGVFFQTPFAERVRLADLSDGYRAMVALSIDLLHHLASAYDDLLENNYSVPAVWLDYVEGVVLIDELDAHLHPTWQRQIGLWLRNRFPRIQFIVTTHSPFIAQAADAGGLYVLRQDDPASAAVTIHQDEESVRGWRVDQILTSTLFGLETTRSPQVEAQLARYDDLQSKQVQGQMTPDEQAELATLEQQLGDLLPAPGETMGQRDFYRQLQDYIAKTLNSTE